KDGTQYGPVDNQELRDMAASGKLSPTDFIREDNKPGWRPASVVTDLFPEDQPRTPGEQPEPVSAAASQPRTSGDQPEPVPVAASATQPCTYCGEEILSIARKCKHCGEFLDP